MRADLIKLNFFDTDLANAATPHYLARLKLEAEASSAESRVPVARWVR